MAKKTNPRNRPVSEADVKRAKKQAQDVLIDKHGYTHDQIKAVQDDLNYLADSVAKGYVKWNDIAQVLEDEYDVHLELQ